MPADPTTDFLVVARFEIRRRRYLAEDGTLVHPLPASLPEPQSLIQLCLFVCTCRMSSDCVEVHTGLLAGRSECCSEVQIAVFGCEHDLQFAGRRRSRQ